TDSNLAQRATRDSTSRCFCPSFRPSIRPSTWRGWDLNPRPPGYEPGELPDCSTPRRCARAGNGTRTRDPNLGKVVLYQLSYSRVGRQSNRSVGFFVPPPTRTALAARSVEARGIEPLTS